MNIIAREIAWRRIVKKWQYLLQHLPAEQNDEADALSRLKAVPRRTMPDLGQAKFVKPPAQNDRLWRSRLDIVNATSRSQIQKNRYKLNTPSARRRQYVEMKAVSRVRGAQLKSKPNILWFGKPHA